MLGDFGEVYVLDWGLAKRQTETHTGAESVQPEFAVQPAATAQGIVTGTLAYMSPEQARGKPELINKSSDIFTLGVILFELLTLERLRPSGTTEAMLLGIYEEQSVRPSARAPRREIPPELDEICVRATQKEPSARYPSARELHAAITRYLAGERDVALRKEMAAKYSQSASVAAERARVQSAWILIGALDWSRLILYEDLRSGSNSYLDSNDHLAEPWAVPLEEARLSSFLAADRGLQRTAVRRHLALRQRPGRTAALCDHAAHRARPALGGRRHA